MKHGIITLTNNQKSVLTSLRRGNILLGGVGSGKTYTSIFWYLENCPEKELIVITTAANRDMIKPGATKPDWHQSIENCGISTYTVDSWNNIQKYKGRKNTCFLFDEQRVVGYGTWSRNFIKLAKEPTNDWLLLSATPGDVWMDYLAVFIANGYYLNKKDFTDRHVEWNPYTPFPSIKRYKGTAVLEKRRVSIVVPMKVERHTVRHRHILKLDYNKELYKQIVDSRFNIFEDKPIESPSEMTMCLRKICNTDPSRIEKTKELIRKHKKVIIFYNFNFELDILREICSELNIKYGEWNGHKHTSIPDKDEWVYLVQYTAGSEGWNCITSDTVLFYSINYAYKKMEQAEGRIDRMNTPFTDLQYYYLTSNSLIDLGIMDSIKNKKDFNERVFLLKEYGVFLSNSKKGVA